MEDVRAMGVVRKESQKAHDALLAEVLNSKALEAALVEARKSHKKAAQVSAVLMAVFLAMSVCKIWNLGCSPSQRNPS